MTEFQERSYSKDKLKIPYSNHNTKQNAFNQTGRARIPVYNGFMRKFDTTPSVDLLTSPDWEDYRLLDSGNGRKLEQFGPCRLIRPEAEAIWDTAMDAGEWKQAL